MDPATRSSLSQTANGGAIWKYSSPVRCPLCILSLPATVRTGDMSQLVFLWLFCFSSMDAPNSPSYLFSWKSSPPQESWRCLLSPGNVTRKWFSGTSSSSGHRNCVHEPCINHITTGPHFWKLTILKQLILAFSVPKHVVQRLFISFIYEFQSLMCRGCKWGKPVYSGHLSCSPKHQLVWNGKTQQFEHLWNFFYFSVRDNLYLPHKEFGVDFFLCNTSSHSCEKDNIHEGETEVQRLPLYAS